ncbi:DUF995 domain-containing protein [Roseospirillum parvum]|uniref:Lipoprotein n=1 Tax=Roseospirillum parvum TaxID=83401 RepID=A0A1G7WH99_9PROT|nr:DUF995 domain-containing protein [Roseospirillum parvum]SDG71326.1 Protein of unknown function [Roseospirillum parvum]
MLRALAILLAALVPLAACVQTVDGALEEGGTRMTNQMIAREMAGRTMQARFKQGYVATHSFTFAADSDALTVDTHDGGRWHPSGDGLLCLEWPKGLKWTRDGYCFAAVKQAGGYGLYDTVIEQIRIELTP